ncbi:MAG: hypothetical protein ACRD2S_01905 [Terriglobales bacterium]
MDSSDLSRIVNSQVSGRIGNPRAFKTILTGGLVAGVLDGLDAAVVISWINRVSAIRVFQFIASGLLGVRAFKEGWVGAAIGCGIHFLIALSVAAAYYLMTLRLPALLKKPELFGPIFGIGVFCFMHYLIVPLSAAPKQPPASAGALLNLVISHTLFVGLPIALIASRSDRLG